MADSISSTNFNLTIVTPEYETITWFIDCHAYTVIRNINRIASLNCFSPSTRHLVTHGYSSIDMYIYLWSPLVLKIHSLHWMHLSERISKMLVEILKTLEEIWIWTHELLKWITILNINLLIYLSSIVCSLLVWLITLLLLVWMWWMMRPMIRSSLGITVCKIVYMKYVCHNII